MDLNFIMTFICVFVTMCVLLIGYYCIMVSKTAVRCTLIVSDISDTRVICAMLLNDDIDLVDATDIVGSFVEVGDYIDAWVYTDPITKEKQAIKESPKLYKSITVLAVWLLLFINAVILYLLA